MPTKKKVPANPVKRGSRLLPISTSVIVLSLTVVAYFVWLKQVDKEKANQSPAPPQSVQTAGAIALPKPVTNGRMSLETAMFNRRSRRDFTDTPISLKQLGQMLWAAQGVTADWGGRTAPSAKSVYPLTLYLAAYKVDSLNSGLYKYTPGELKAAHQIALVKEGNFKDEIGAAVGQNAAKNPAALVIITGNMGKMAKAFNDKPVDSNVYLEAGHAAENMYLEAESLSLGMVTIAGFNPDKVKLVIGIPDDETIIYAIPIGVPKK